MNHLGVFAKYWQPGTVKTRLAKSIGPVKAAELYRDFVGLTLLRFSMSADTRSLWYWPPERKGEFDLIASTHWQVYEQVSGDLGKKIRGYFKSTLALRRPVVLIGSDTPNLPIRLVDQALEMLENVDVVIGPSKDGGYYLIGMRMEAPVLFQDIPWSTTRVLDSTIDRTVAGGYSYRLLEPWRDVDTFDDLVWLQQQLVEPNCENKETEVLQKRIVAAINPMKSRETKQPSANPGPSI